MRSGGGGGKGGTCCVGRRWLNRWYDPAREREQVSHLAAFLSGTVWSAVFEDGRTDGRTMIVPALSLVTGRRMFNLVLVAE